MNFLRQGFRKLSSHRHKERHDRNSRLVKRGNCQTCVETVRYGTQNSIEYNENAKYVFKARFQPAFANRCTRS